MNFDPNGVFERVYPEIFVDEKEYFFREERTSHRHEYFKGRMSLLPLGNIVHADICQNFRLSIHEQLPKGWWIFGSTSRLKIAATGLWTYADAVLITPETHFVREGNDSDTVLNPQFLGEVSSSHTALYDRTTKCDHYRTLPSLRDFVIVSAECVRVEHFARCGDDWTFNVYTTLDQSFSLPFFDVKVELAKIYEDLHFPVPSAVEFCRTIPEDF